jgi:hypothetical protein
MKANEAAYPSQPLDGSGMPKYEAESGLTKLELFSAMAMQGLLAHYGNEGAEECAYNSVNIARALIAELEKQP